MSEQLLTKCPHCSTTFRLGQEQLEIAGGAVRCGACYQVFHASEHIVKTAAVEEIPTPTSEESPDPFQEFEPTATEATTSSDDPYAVDNWDLDNHPDADLFAENYHENIATPETELEELGYSDENKKPNTEDNDEAWAEKLLEEMGENSDPMEPDEVPDLIQDDPEKDNEHLQSNTGFSSISSSESAFSDGLGDDVEADDKDELSNSFSQLDNWSEDDPFAIQDEEDNPLPTGAVDESWAQAMLSELEQDTNPEPNLDHLEIMEDEPENEDNPFAAKNLSGEIPAVKKAKPHPTSKQTQKTAEKKTSSDNRLFEAEDFFSQLAPEHDIDDIELGAMPDLLEDDTESMEDVMQDAFTHDSQDIIDQQISASASHFGIEDEAPRSSFTKVAALVVLNVLTLGALCGQFVYFQYDELARNETYRPYFKKLCEQTGCTLPLKSDVSQIRGSNLVVRSHSMERNALVIDAIVYNRAKFAQPYPVIELRFDDVNGTPMASRRFTPKEYIHDNSIDLDNMPSDTPVHLTLEIVDPGQRAVNYQMNFYPTEQTTI